MKRSFFILQYVVTALLCFASFIFYHFADKSWVEFFSAQPFTYEVEYFFRVLDILGEPQWYLLPCLAMLSLFRSSNSHAAKAWYFVFMNVLLVSVVVFSLKWWLGRARPGQYFLDGTYGFYPDWLHYNASFMSFPSGHAAVIFAFAFAICMVFPSLGYFALPFAVVVSSSRLALTWHYPSDVLAGIACALYLTLVLYKYTFGGNYERT